MIESFYPTSLTFKSTPIQDIYQTALIY